MARSRPVPYTGGMAKITRTNSLSALVEGAPTFAAGTRRFSVGVSSAESGITYHLHLSEDEAKQFAAFVADTRRGLTLTC